MFQPFVFSAPMPLKNKTKITSSHYFSWSHKISVHSWDFQGNSFLYTDEKSNTAQNLMHLFFYWVCFHTCMKTAGVVNWHNSLIVEKHSGPFGCCGAQTTRRVRRFVFGSVSWTEEHIWEENLPFSMLHQFNGIVNLLQGHGVCDELIQHHLLFQVGFNHLDHAVLTKPFATEDIRTTEQREMKSNRTKTWWMIAGVWRSWMVVRTDN